MRRTCVRPSYCRDRTHAIGPVARSEPEAVERMTRDRDRLNVSERHAWVRSSLVRPQRAPESRERRCAAVCARCPAASGPTLDAGVFPLCSPRPLSTPRPGYRSRAKEQRAVPCGLPTLQCSDAWNSIAAVGPLLFTDAGAARAPSGAAGRLRVVHLETVGRGLGRPASGGKQRGGAPTVVCVVGRGRHGRGSPGGGAARRGPRSR
jgi:hypothetical protein